MFDITAGMYFNTEYYFSKKSRVVALDTGQRQRYPTPITQRVRFMCVMCVEYVARSSDVSQRVEVRRGRGMSTTMVLEI